MLRSEEVAAEVLQEVFLKVWQLRHTLNSIDNPAGWMYTIASNYSLSALRKIAREKIRVEAITHDDIEDNEDVTAAFRVKELQLHISHAIDQLPASRREVFLLNTQEGKSRKEIAEALDISEHTVKNQLVTARKFIREYLEKHTGDYLPVFLIGVLLRIF